MNWLSALREYAPVLLGAGLGALAYLLARWVSGEVRLRGAQARLAHVAGDGALHVAAVDVGSEAYKVRLAFARHGFDAAGREGLSLWTARIVLAGVLIALIWMLGFPPLTLMAGPVLAWFFVQGAVDGAWSAMRREVEMEVPTFLLRMSGTAQVQPNVQRALEEVEPTLNPNGSLRKWIHRFAARLQAGGRPALKEMLDEAEAISPSLGLAVFEIGRLWEAGGAGYPRALAQAAENLGAILDGRAQADAKAAGAKRAMLVVLGALVLVTGVMMRNPTISASIRSPVIQVMYLLIAVWVAIGWAQVNSMIEEAVT